MYKVTFAKKIVDGDVVFLEESRIEVKEVKRVRGRKPKKGENLDFFTSHGIIRVNSLMPIRVWRGV